MTKNSNRIKSQELCITLECHLSNVFNKAWYLLANIGSEHMYASIKKGKQNQKKLTLIQICIVSFSFCGFRYFSQKSRRFFVSFWMLSFLSLFSAGSSEISEDSCIWAFVFSTSIQFSLGFRTITPQPSCLRRESHTHTQTRNVKREI